MNTTLTPATLSLLIHCYSQPDNMDFDLSPYAADIAEWEKDGILKKDCAWGSTPASGYIYRTTARGEAWLKLMLRTPRPIPAFVDHHGVVIE